MAIVYRITNKINGKSYIGQTVRTLDQRWRSHLSSVNQGSKFRFHSAIRKYGVDNWKLDILFENDDVDLCKKKEEELIALYNLTNNKKGYNATPGGCGGWVVPYEKYEFWRKKQSINNTGLNNPNSTGYSNEELIEIGIPSIILKQIGKQTHRIEHEHIDEQKQGLKEKIKECI